MVMLVTVDEVKEMLVIEHDLDDNRIRILIMGASQSVLNYLKPQGYSRFYDGNEIKTGAVVPENVRVATLIYISMLYEQDSLKEQEQAFIGHTLPKSVVTLLYQDRDPALSGLGLSIPR